MINFQFFPRSNGVTPQIRDIINCFKKVDENRDENVHLKSNEMLALVRPHLEALHFTVESGKAADEQIYVPVLFSENDQVDKFFAADALSEDHKIVIEVVESPILTACVLVSSSISVCTDFSISPLNLILDKIV